MTPQEIEYHVRESIHTTIVIAFVLFAIFGTRALWARMANLWQDHDHRIAMLERLYEYQSAQLRRVEYDTVKRNQELVSAIDNVVSNIDKLATKIRHMDSKATTRDHQSSTDSSTITTTSYTIM